MTFENNYGTDKPNDFETQQDPDTQFTAEQMRDVDTQQRLEQESVVKMNDVLNNMNRLPNNDFVKKISNLLQNLGEKAKKGPLIGAAVLGITMGASVPSFGEQIAQNGLGVSGRLQVGQPITAKTYLPENANAADKRLNIDSTDFNNPNRLRLRPLNQTRLEGQQKNRVLIDGRNIYNGNNQAFQRQLNQYEQRQILPGATVNDESVYEIAPGVYGNRHSQHGNGISIGTFDTN